MLLIALTACKSDHLVVPADTAVVDEALWADLSLVLESPASGDFIPMEDGGTFAAHLVNAEGELVEFDELTWTTNMSQDWVQIGSAIEDDTLAVGVHDITVTAELPTGDRLSHTVGGVLVQSHYAGTYSGDMKVNMAAQGYEVGCSGAATIYVDAYGELVQGASGCLLSLQGFEIDSDFVLAVQNDDGVLSGDIAVTVYGYELPMEFSGDVTEDGLLTGEFAGDVFGQAEFDGTLEVNRISRETTGFAN
ncbi:MAG: hypothetical protein GY913_07290 [Proteobacteria bacterium]|nr:hypothetical protein [Pseudomonadota bacterium]MCP4916713.1 hypothetical protein [Pseudomonadota bacterium]